MELRQIQYFIQLYEDRNFTKASKKLFISQQGLSKSTARLEEELGLALFERNVQGVIPTMEGEQLYPYFRKVLQDYQQLIDTTDYLKGKRTLKVLGPEGLASKSSREDFMKYAKENPDLDLIYREARNDDIPGKLDRGEAEIGCVRGILFSGLQKECILRREPVCVILSARHPMAGRDKIRVREMHGSTLFFMEDYNELENWFCRKLDDGKIQYRILNKRVIEGLYLHYLYDSNYCGIGFASQFQTQKKRQLRFVPLCDDTGKEYVGETALIVSPKQEITQEMKGYLEYHRKLYRKYN